VKFAAILGIALATFAVAEESHPEAPSTGQILRGVSNTPWLGLEFGEMSDAVRAHVPALPPGIGFVVTNVTPGSPAEKAGVKSYDIFWKLGDQLITNKAQLSTLLNLQKEGDEVNLGLYRSGQELSVRLALGRQPNDQLLAGAPVKTAGLDVPVKVFYPAEGSGEIGAADGKVTLSLVNGQAVVKIVASGGAIVFEGPIRNAEGVSTVPVAWEKRVSILERGLVDRMNNPRPPRMRVLPPPADQK
jgi:membrane-associated protease RseP (regulator of RpoE activity)